MKKIHLLTLSAIILSALNSFGQTSMPRPGKPDEPTGPKEHFLSRQNTGNEPIVTIGTIDTKITSREKVLAYPRLLTQQLNCEVTAFSCTITCNGKTYGPFVVKGAVFNDDIKDKVKELEAPPSVKISINNILVKCNGGDDVAAAPINVEYDH